MAIACKTNHKLKDKGERTMGTLIPQNKYDVLPPGTYLGKVGAVAVEDGIYGTQVVMRFDSPNPLTPAESQGITDEEPPW
jgi:hypothetical protein